MRLDNQKMLVRMAQKNLNQTTLATAAGISRVTVNSLCRGATCKPETAERIAEALGVPVEKLEAVRRRV